MKKTISHNDVADDKFITGIYNYCDRWCERCEFTGRCRTFAMEQADPWTEEEMDPGNESFGVKLGSIFAEAKQMLIEKAEELGIDPTPMSDEEFAEIQKREKAFVDADELSQLGEEYWRSAKELLDKPEDWLPNPSIDNGSVDGALSVLSWFLFFIPVKMATSLHGLLDEEGYLDEEQATDSQSHANGTMKIGLIAVDRSIIAWTSLAEFDIDRVRPLIELLEKLRTLAEKRFPLARDFIRPGFDEAELVM